MKKYVLYLFLMMPLAMGVSSCSDDDNDVPDVSVSATISGGVFYDDEIYVVQGDDLKVEALNLINRTQKDGSLGVVSYYWDNYLIGTNVLQPFGLVINTAEQAVGRHLLQAQMPVYVVDYPVCWGYVQYRVNVVESSEQLPENGDEETSKVIQGEIQTKD